jgi:Tfp pilus assembly protein PilO
MSTIRQYQLALFLVMVTAALFIATIVLPLWYDAFEAYGELAGLGSESQRHDHLMQELQVHENRLEELKRRREGLIRERDQSEAGLLTFVSAEAQGTGVRILSMVPRTSKEAGVVREQEVAFELRGSYHRVGMFLYHLETGPFSFTTESLELRPSAAGSTTLHARLQGTALLAMEGR